jgi:hypothetical protein
MDNNRFTNTAKNLIAFLLVLILSGDYVFSQKDSTNKVEIDKSIKYDTVILKGWVPFRDDGIRTHRKVVFANDTLYKILYFSDGNGNKRFGGTYNNFYGSIYSYYRSGELSSISFNWKGRLYGVSRNYYKNGTLESVGFEYDPGKDTIVDSAFFEGKMWYTVQPCPILKKGLWQYFNENGELIKEELYNKQGVLIRTRAYRKDD